MIEVRTRAVTALLAGPVIALVAACSPGGPPQAPTAQQAPAVRQNPAVPPPPAIQQHPADQQAAPLGYLQLGHLAPDAPSFTGYLARFGEDGQLIGSGGYGNLSPYMALPPGRYVWSVRPADSPPDSPLTLTKLIEVKAGQAGSVVLFNNGPQGSLQGVASTDDTAAPPAGMAKVRVAQGAAGAPLAMSLGEQPTQEISYGTVTPYQIVPAGPLTIQASAAHPPMMVNVTPDSLSTVLVTRTSRGVHCALVADRIMGSPLGARTPTGTNSGSGGLAASSSFSPALIGGLAGSGALLVLIAGALLLAERRRNA